MSAIDSDFSSSDYVSETANGDKLSLFNMAFSDWIVIKLSNSDLYPQNYQLRHIEEKGSIADSLQAAKIDLFDRVPIERNRNFDTIRKIAVFAITFFSTLYCSFFGALYHGSVTIKHLVMQLLCKKEDAAHNWKKVQLAIARLRNDFFFSLFAIGWAIYRELGIGGFLPAVLPGLLNGCRTLADLQPLALTYLNGDGSSDCFYKSMVLRREFGIVNKSGGCLSNWDPVKDKDLLFSYTTGFGRDKIISKWDPIKDKNSLPWGSKFYYELTGYFGNLHIEQGKQFISLIKELQNTLPQDCKFAFSYPPIAEKIADFLEKNRTVSGLSDAEVEEWKQKFNTLSNEMTLIGDLLSLNTNLMSLGLIRLELSFPLDEATCLTQLKEGSA